MRTDLSADFNGRPFCPTLFPLISSQVQSYLFIYFICFISVSIKPIWLDQFLLVDLFQARSIILFHSMFISVFLAGAFDMLQSVYISQFRTAQVWVSRLIWFSSTIHFVLHSRLSLSGSFGFFFFFCFGPVFENMMIHKALAHALHHTCNCT